MQNQPEEHFDGAQQCDNTSEQPINKMVDQKSGPGDTSLVKQTTTPLHSTTKKGPSFDSNKQRLERLISDSNKRRSRYQRDVMTNGLQGALTNHTQDILSPNKNEVAIVSVNAGGGSQVCPEERREIENGAKDRKDRTINEINKGDIEDQQYSEIVERYSNFAMTSNGSRFNKEILFNQTLNISSSRKNTSKKPSNATAPVNFLEKNKRLVEPKKETNQIPSTAQNVQHSKLWHQQLRSEKNLPNPSIGSQLAAKVVKAKINTNLRSSSSSGQIRGRTKSPVQRAKEQQPKVKLGMSPGERLKQEIDQRLKDQKEMEKIESQIKNKYQEIESILQANMESGSPGRVLNGDISEIDHVNDNSTFGKHSIMTDTKPPMSASKKKNGDISSAKKIGSFHLATEARSAQRNASKSTLNSGRPTIKNINPTVPSQTIDLTDRPSKISQSKAGSIQRSAGRNSVKERPQISKQKNVQEQEVQKDQITPQTKPTRLGQRNQVNRLSQPTKTTQAKKVTDVNQNTKDKSPFRKATSKDQNEGFQSIAASAPRQSMTKAASNMSSSKLRKMSNSSTPANQNQTDGPRLNLRSDDGARSQSELAIGDDVTGKASNTKKSFNNPGGMSNTNKDEIMNLDIEKVWKEMEEINRSKKAAQDLFQAFQDKYYDQSDPVFYDQEQMSPTKRLISMKNATTKHHVIEYRKGITGRYAIQYTTCPEKSYVILPDEGQTDYDQFKDKNAHQFVEKIINGTVEKVELEERGKRKKSNPNSRIVTNRSPVRINREHCQRAELIGSFNLNIQPDEQNQQSHENDENPHEQEIVVVTTQQDKPDIEEVRQEGASKEAIHEEDQRHNDENEASIDHEDSIINICSNGKNSVIVVEEKNGSGSRGSHRQSIITKPEVNQTEIKNEPFLSDEQPIKVENSSIISNTHEMFDHPVHDNVEASREEEGEQAKSDMQETQTVAGEAQSVGKQEEKEETQENVEADSQQVTEPHNQFEENKLQEQAVVVEEISTYQQKQPEDEEEKQDDEINKRSENVTEDVNEASEQEKASPQQQNNSGHSKPSGRRRNKRRNRF